MWCEIADAFQTAALEKVDDYSLNALARDFRLSATLLV